MPQRISVKQRTEWLRRATTAIDLDLRPMTVMVACINGDGKLTRKPVTLSHVRFADREAAE